MKFYVPLFAAVCASCAHAGSAPSADLQRAAVDPHYAEEIRTWHEQRIRTLRKENGWLTLAGLYWLKPGETSFGGSPERDFVFPSGTAPKLGTLVVEPAASTDHARAPVGARVTLRPEPGTSMTVIGSDGVPRGIVSAPTLLVSDASDDVAPTRIRLGALTFLLIDRGGKLGIRLYDASSPLLRSFQNIDTFPVDPRFRVVARWRSYDAHHKVKLATVIDGLVQEEEVPGIATFTMDGRELSLEPVLEKGERDYFFAFRDETSGKETYGAGRFLYASPPKDGAIVIDFNRAYNPPCAFTPYATCPLPPPQNRLPIRVVAGEKTFAHEGGRPSASTSRNE